MMMMMMTVTTMIMMMGNVTRILVEAQIHFGEQRL
jgi:hypothetical protein